MGDEFVRLGVSPAKLRVLDHGFARLANQAQAGGAGGTRERGHASPLRIGYVGTLVWHKGVHVLIDACRALPNHSFELHLFGDPDVDPGYSEDLRQRAAGVAVRFRGEFTRDAVLDAYSNLDVVVVPSLWPENSPLVIREAFMARVPVVGARIGGIPELVTDGKNGLLYDPLSPTDLTRALRTLVDDRRMLESFARNCPAVKSMDVHAREWESIYSDLLRRP